MDNTFDAFQLSLSWPPPKNEILSCLPSIGATMPKWLPLHPMVAVVAVGDSSGGVPSLQVRVLAPQWAFSSLAILPVQTWEILCWVAWPKPEDRLQWWRPLPSPILSSSHPVPSSSHPPVPKKSTPMVITPPAAPHQILLAMGPNVDWHWSKLWSLKVPYDTFVALELVVPPTVTTSAKGVRTGT